MIVTSNDIEKYCKILAEKINEAKKDYSALIALNRGGIVPLGYLSYYLENRNTKILEIVTRDGNIDKFTLYRNIEKLFDDILTDKPVLIIDDLIDTGYTLKLLDEMIKTYNENNIFSVKYDVAVFLANIETKNKLKKEINANEIFYVDEMPGEWVYFPWDKKD